MPRDPWKRPFWERHLSRQVQFLLDSSVLASAFALAYLLRFDFQVPPKVMETALGQLPMVLIFQYTALVVTGIYSFIWRYIGLSEVRAFVIAATYSSMPLLLLRFALPESLHTWRVPLSVILIDVTFAFGGLLALRVLRRSLYESYERQRKANGSNGKNKPVLLVGAGRAGVTVAKEIHGRGDMGLEIVGFIDDDPAKAGSRVHGVKVLGSTRDLPRICRELAIEQVILTIVESSRQEIRRIVEVCERAQVKVRIVPGLYEIVDGSVAVSRIRDVEIEDLLGREPVQLEEDRLRLFLSGRRVMVTGAGGSIGSELARQIARQQPSSLLLVERAEFALFQIDREIARRWPHINRVPLVADVGDEGRMRAVLAEGRPEVILHAAAHKHVPLMESNCSEAVKNNVLATRQLGELAGEYEVESFILISTDKAVKPSSAMGASKRLAELVIQDLDRRSPTHFVAVRFGNVMGSTGSVISIFRDQIKKGGPVTVTHPEMARYFMTIPEAAQLVLHAGAIGRGGEIFILDMGEPVRILQLAKDMITLSGLRPYEDIDIVFTGIRPGEKLFEELALSGEELGKTRHPKIFIGNLATGDSATLAKALRELELLADLGLEHEIREVVRRALPEARLAATQADLEWPSQRRPDGGDSSERELAVHDEHRRPSRIKRRRLP